MTSSFIGKSVVDAAKKAIPMAGKIGIIGGGVLILGLLTYAIVRSARN